MQLQFQNYRIIRVDDRNLAVQRNLAVKKRTGVVQRQWITCGYFSSLAPALKFLADELPMRDAARLEDISAEIEDLREWINENLRAFKGSPL